MNRSKVILLLGALVLIVGGPLVFIGCSDPTEGKEDAVVKDVVEPAEGSTPLVVEGTKYAFTDETTIYFEGYKISGSHNGEFVGVTGAVTVPDGDLAKAHIDLTIDMTTLDSDDGALTKKLKSSDFFEVETYPTSKFVTTKIVATDDGFDVSGNLDMHGINKNITFPAQIEIDGNTLTAEAEFTIKRFDWDITYPGKAEDLIHDEVLIVFEIEAAVQESE